ncbi:alpha/beta fold hydrolase [Luedemannella helvata]
MDPLVLTHWESGRLDARPVVLLHGLTSTGETWDEVAAGLSDRAQVVVVDQRGHGASPWPGEYGFALMRDDLLRTLATLDLLDRRPVLVGHSMGGVVAYLAAQARPDAFAALVLEDPVPPVPLPRDPGERPDGPLPYDWDVVPAIFDDIMAPDPRWLADLGTVPCPVLVVGGDHSHIPQRLLVAMAERFPRGRYLALDTDHSVHANRPGEFVAAVRAVLDEHDL